MPHIARQSTMSNGAGSKVGLEVMPIASVTLSDAHGPGERAQSRRSLKRGCEMLGVIYGKRADRGYLRA